MKYKAGFIGTGNMASAIIKVMSEKVNGSDIYLSNRTEAKASALAERYGANVSTNVEIAKTCDYIILGIKPQMMKGVLDEIKPALAERDDFIIVSMAAGFTIDDYYEMISKECPLIRIMPNTPVMVNEGVILYCYKYIEKNKVDEFVNAIEKAGKLIDIDEENHQLKLSIKEFTTDVKKTKREKIVETSKGFTNISSKLDSWINSKINEIDTK